MGTLGQDFVELAVESRLRAFAQNIDREQLVAAQQLLTRYIASLGRQQSEGTRERIQSARDKLEKVDSLLVTLHDEGEPRLELGASPPSAREPVETGPRRDVVSESSASGEELDESTMSPGSSQPPASC